MREEVQKESEEICKVDRISNSLVKIKKMESVPVLSRGLLISSSLVASSLTVSGSIRSVASFLFVSFVRQIVLRVNFCDRGFL